MALDISEARAGSGGRGPARPHAGGSGHTGLQSRCKGAGHATIETASLAGGWNAGKEERKGRPEERAYDDGGEQGRAVGGSCGSACQINDGYRL